MKGQRTNEFPGCKRRAWTNPTGMIQYQNHKLVEKFQSKMEIIKSNKGKDKLYYDGHIYVQKITKKHWIRWVCFRHRTGGCKGALTSSLTYQNPRSFEFEISLFLYIGSPNSCVFTGGLSSLFQLLWWAFARWVFCPVCFCPGTLVAYYTINYVRLQEFRSDRQQLRMTTSSYRWCLDCQQRRIVRRQNEDSWHGRGWIKVKSTALSTMLNRSNRYIKVPTQCHK